jgi:hypothetical protein
MSCADDVGRFKVALMSVPATKPSWNGDREPTDL